MRIACRSGPGYKAQHKNHSHSIQQTAPRASKSADTVAASVTASSPKGEMLREMEKRSGSCNSATGTGKGTVERWPRGRGKQSLTGVSEGFSWLVGTRVSRDKPRSCQSIEANHVPSERCQRLLSGCHSLVSSRLACYR